MRSDRKLDFLKEKHTDVAPTKKKITDALDRRGTKYDGGILAKAFEIIDWYYGTKPRKEPTILASVHAYSVMYDCAELGCDFEHVLAAGFHDTYEDGYKPVDEVQGKIGEMLGTHLMSRLHGMVFLLTNHDRRVSHYSEFLRQIYESRDIQLMVTKAMDSLESVKTMDFAGAKPSFKNSVCRKALMHIDIWKKLDRELFRIMMGFLRQAQNGLSEANKRRITRESGVKSLRQMEYEANGIAVLTRRGEFSLEFLRNLPYSGSRVLTVFAPGTLQDRGYIEIEVHQEAISRNKLVAMLRKHFPEMRWTAVKSALPAGLACSWIFRSRDKVPDRFLDRTRILSKDVFLEGGLGLT